MPQVPAQARAYRGFRRQVAPLAVLAIVVTAVFGVAALRRQADAGAEAVALLARIEANTQGQYAELNKSVANQATDPTLLTKVEADRAALGSSLQSLADLGVPAVKLQVLAEAEATFRDRADIVYRMLANGQPSLAVRRVQAEVWPAMSSLQASVTEISEACRVRADQSRAMSDIGSLAILLAAGTIVWLLLRRASRDRAAVERAEVESASQARFRALVQNSTDMITVLDTNAIVRYMSPSVVRVLGYDPDELLGIDMTTLVHPDDAASANAAFVAAFEQGQSEIHLECRVRHANGSWRCAATSVSNRLDDPDVQGWILNSRDVTERNELEEQLVHQAFHDALTGLANRALFRDRVEHALSRMPRHPEGVAVLLFDLDAFKTVNDSLGHAFGDKVLIGVAERLGRLLRPSDTACRLGGDEFAVLVEELDDAVDARIVANRVLEAMRVPFVVDGKEVTSSASVGLALVDGAENDQTADDLLRNADVAMYTAKARGRDRYEMFKPSMHQAMLDRLDLEADLRRAVERNEFVLHYQPTVSLIDGRISGMEALVRWASPERGTVPPGVFIGVAEDTGLIVKLGSWVLEEACRQAMAWRHEFGADATPTMSVNVSARQLQDDGLVEDFARILRDTGINPASVTLELTESAVMTDAEAMIDRLHELKALGVKIAIDDFGTGYSSMSYLCNLPIDILKIDRSFVSGVRNEPQKMGIVRTIVELGRILSLQTVAEGIELDEELEQLQFLQCDLGQGYLFARPLTPDQVLELLGRQMVTRRREEFSLIKTPVAS